MTKEERSFLKLRIDEEIKRLKSEIESLRSKIKPVSPEHSLGRLTRMEALNEKSVNESILLKSEQRLKKLLFVKDRVESDDYGICNLCDEEIPYERMKIIPESTICLECAKEMQ